VGKQTAWIVVVLTLVVGAAVLPRAPDVGGAAAATGQARAAAEPNRPDFISVPACGHQRQSGPAGGHATTTVVAFGTVHERLTRHGIELFA